MVLLHALTVSHRTYDDHFALYFRSRQLWWQRYYQKHDYFLGATLCVKPPTSSGQPASVQQIAARPCSCGWSQPSLYIAVAVLKS